MKKKGLTALFLLLSWVSGFALEKIALRSCPAIDQLTLDSQSKLWHATGGWKTFDVSFDTKITKFLGARWEGVNLGSIFCLYKGDHVTFNIRLQSPGLVYNPSGGRWSKDLGGYKNCIASRQADCQFLPFVHKQTEGVGKVMEELKNSSASFAQDE